ncbi:hypothetical protein D9M73_184730 [compost metagenome]
MRVAIAHHRPHTGPGGQHIGAGNRCRRKLQRAGLQQVVHLGLADARVLIQSFPVIEVGGADHGRPLPGKHEHRPPIGGMHEADGMGQRQAPAGHQQMAATQRADVFASPGRAQAIRPGSGRQGHGAATEGETPAALPVLGFQAVHPVLFTLEVDDAHTVQRLAAFGARLA